MTDLLQFPDDEAKAFRRARAEKIRAAERDGRIVAGYLVLLDDIVSRLEARAVGRHCTGNTTDDSEPALARSLLDEIKGQPAQIRNEVGIVDRCLKLKGLVDEAELKRFMTVTACEPSSLDMAREVNDDLRNRFDARRAPARLTPELISDNLSLPGAPFAGSAAGPVPSPQEIGAGSAVAGSIGGRSVGAEPVLGIAEGDTRGLRPSRLGSVVKSLFHGATMPRLLRKVLEKGRGLFSRAGGGA